VNIIIDTNIIFSAILNDKGKIGQLLFNKPAGVRFISPIFLLNELNQHRQKILKLTGYSEEEYEFVKNLITAQIEFIDQANIHNTIWEEAYLLLADIDEKDVSFLALTIANDGLLWTGDLKLINGLNNKNINKTITTDSLYLKYFES
jgi:predicted nucleic acid-binding protein